MKQWMHEQLYLFYSGVLILHVVNAFIGHSTINYIVGILAIPMLLISFIGATRLFKILGGVFILTGMIMFFSANLSIYRIPEFLTSNMSLLAFIAVLPWINSAVHVGRFDQRINELLKENVDNLGTFYGRSILTTYTLMTFLNLSAVTLAQDVLIKNMKNVKKRIRDSFISRTTVRAFCLALIWSPMEVMVAITVDYTGVSYLVYLPWLLLISLIGLSLDILWGRKSFKSIPYKSAVQNKRPVVLKKVLKEIIKLFIALVLFLTTIIVISHVFSLNFILAVTLVIIPFSTIWALLMKRWYYFRVFGWRIWKDRTNHMQNFVVLFISLSIFSNSLNETPFLQLIQKPFSAFEAYPIVILFFILITYLMLAMVGVHPIATIGVLNEVLKPMYTIINPLGIGIVLIVAAMATSSAATYGVCVTMTSMNTGQNPYRITLTNLPFTFMFGIIGIFIAYLLI